MRWDPWVLGILGLFAGAAAGGMWGAVAGCVLGALLGSWIRKSAFGTKGGDASPLATDLRDPEHLRRHVTSLTERVSRLEEQLARLSLPVAAGPPPANSASVAPSAAPEATPPVLEPSAPSVAPVPPATAHAADVPDEQALPYDGTRSEERRAGLWARIPVWNWLFGGNALVRIGVLVLFFGVAFLVRYAAEHVDVPIEARLSGVSLGAIVMLILGWRLRMRAGGYGLVLQGGGVGVLYLVVFGAFRVWQLLPAELAFVLLVVIALGSALLAVAQDAKALAVFSVSGGFLAPLLASTGQGSHVALFGYYVVLNLGVLTMAWYRAWRVLNLVGFFFTFGIGTLWGAFYYQPQFYDTMQSFLIAFFLLYVAIGVLYAMRRAPQLSDYVDSVLIFGTPLVSAGLQFALVKEIEYGAAWSAVTLGAFYSVAAYQLWKMRRESLQLLVECFIALGVAFATLAIPLAFDGRWTAASWALEGAAVLWVGTRQRRPLAQYFGLLLQPAAGAAFLLASGASVGAMPILNSGFVGALTLAVAGLFCSWYLWARERDAVELHRVAAGTLLAWGTLWWLGAGWEEARRFAPREMMLSLQLGYATLTAPAFVYLRRRYDWPRAAYGALALLVVMAIWAWHWSARGLHPFADFGFIAWPAAFAVLYWVLARVEGDIPEMFPHAAHCGALWLLALVGGWECAWQLDAAVGAGRIWSEVGRPLVPAVLVAWIASQIAANRWPVGPQLRLYLAYALPPLVAALWTWVLYVNVTSRGDPQPLPYVPGLNPLDLAVALIAVVGMRWWRALCRIDRPPLLRDLGSSLPALLGATGFVWANGMLLRSLHHWADVPFRWQAMWRSPLVQASFSVFWSVLALGVMVFAHRRGMRGVWISGAALLGVVVVKLFLLDLSRIGGVERIVSFVGVGVLLLVIGYLAPVPPRQAKEE